MVVIMVVIIIIIINNNDNDNDNDNDNNNNNNSHVIPASLHPILRSNELQQVAHGAKPPPPLKEGGLEILGAIQT